MNLDARARASAQAIDRSATRLDAVAGLDELLRRRRRQPLQRAAAATALAVLVAVMALWAGVALRGPTPIQPTLGPITRFRVGPNPVSVALSPGAAWVLNSGNDTISRVDPSTGRTPEPSAIRAYGVLGTLIFATFADGRLWVVHLQEGSSGHGISAIDPSTGGEENTFSVGGAVFEGSGIDGDLAVGAGAVWVSLRLEMRSNGSMPSPAGCATASRSQDRPRWPWTTGHFGSRPPMGACTASTSTPERRR